MPGPLHRGHVYYRHQGYRHRDGIPVIVIGMLAPQCAHKAALQLSAPGTHPPRPCASKNSISEGQTSALHRLASQRVPTKAFRECIAQLAAMPATMTELKCSKCSRRMQCACSSTSIEIPCLRQMARSRAMNSAAKVGSGSGTVSSDLVRSTGMNLPPRHTSDVKATPTMQVAAQFRLWLVRTILQSITG